jgi:hypothetical protein
LRDRGSVVCSILLKKQNQQQINYANHFVFHFQRDRSFHRVRLLYHRENGQRTRRYDRSSRTLIRFHFEDLPRWLGGREKIL